MTLKNTYYHRVLVTVGMVFALSVLAGTSSAYALDKVAMTGEISAPQAIQTISNGYIDVVYKDDTGEYTFKTGPLHSSPGTNILFPVGTGYDTVRSINSATDYVADDFIGTLLGVPAIATTPTSVTFTWNVNANGDNLTIKRSIVISGTTEADSNVRVTTTVLNNSQDIKTVSIRHFWDYQIGPDDGPLYATRSPDGLFSFLETDYLPPTHLWAAIDDNVGNPTQTAAVADRADQVREVYGQWPTMFGTTYAYTSTPGANADSDSAVLFYSKDYSLPHGGTAEFWTALAPTETNPCTNCIVGGELLPIDTTALLVAGAQTSAIWILSALTVIGSVAFGTLYFKTKRD